MTVARYGYFLLLPVFLGLAVILGFTRIENSTFRSWFDVYSAFMTAPTMLIFPGVVCAVASWKAYSEVRHRQLVSTATRRPVQTTALTRTWQASAVAALAGFAYVLVPYLLIREFDVSRSGSSVNPSMYEMTPDEALATIIDRATYSQFAALGDFTYAILYALIVASGAAALAAVSTSLVYLLRAPLLAVAIPQVLYIGQTVLVSLFDRPQFGIMFALFPFGLEQQPVATGLAVIAATVFLALALGITVQRSREWPQRL